MKTLPAGITLKGFVAQTFFALDADTGYVTTQLPYPLSHSQSGAFYQYIQRQGERKQDWTFSAFLSTANRDEVGTLTRVSLGSTTSNSTFAFCERAGGTVSEGEAFPQVVIGVQALKEALLGPASMGERLLGSDERKRNG